MLNVAVAVNNMQVFLCRFRNEMIRADKKREIVVSRFCVGLESVQDSVLQHDPPEGNYLHDANDSVLPYYHHLQSEYYY